jgi:uncharacterized damage-inducible protein DinB
MADLIEALLDSWDRNNTILTNLLRVLPQAGLDARAMEGSPSVAQMFMHIHYVRLVLVFENAPDFAAEPMGEEWRDERDTERIAEMLNESAKAVDGAVRNGLLTNRAMERHYDHPILLMQHMIWHEGYHHGQIKLALKIAGYSLSDEIAGPATWAVWMQKTHQGPAG